MGSALPGEAVSTASLLAHVDATFGLDLGGRGRAVARRLQVGNRHLARDLRRRHESARPGNSNAQLAAQAVRAALQDAGRDITEVAYLVAHTATPGTQLPPGVAQVAELLGYDGPYVELRQACTGFANALVFASALGAGAAAGVVVIVGSETGSIYFDPLRAAADDAQLVNLLQMGDGAAAIVLASDAGIAGHSGGAASGAGIVGHYFGQLGCTRPAAFRLAAGGSDHGSCPRTQAEFDHDFAAISRDGEQLFRAGLCAAERLGASAHSVDWIIPHQANGRMGELLSKALRVPRERVFVNADRLGNTGSAAIWLALAELRPRLEAGARVLVLGAEASKFMYGGLLYVHA